MTTLARISPAERKTQTHSRKSLYNELTHRLIQNRQVIENYAARNSNKPLVLAILQTRKITDEPSGKKIRVHTDADWETYRSADWNREYIENLLIPNAGAVCELPRTIYEHRVTLAELAQPTLTTPFPHISWSPKGDEPSFYLQTNSDNAPLDAAAQKLREINPDLTDICGWQHPPPMIAEIRLVSPYVRGTIAHNSIFIQIPN